MNIEAAMSILKSPRGCGSADGADYLGAVAVIVGREFAKPGQRVVLGLAAAADPVAAVHVGRIPRRHCVHIGVESCADSEVAADAEPRDPDARRGVGPRKQVVYCRGRVPVVLFYGGVDFHFVAHSAARVSVLPDPARHFRAPRHVWHHVLAVVNLRHGNHESITGDRSRRPHDRACELKYLGEEDDSRIAAWRLGACSAG